MSLLVAANPVKTIGDNVADAGLFGNSPNVAAVAPFATVGGNSGWQAVRTPNVFKTIQATAVGNTPIWTPAAGKSFRLMRFMMIFTGNATAAVAGVLTASFQDGATPINIAMDGFIPTTVASPASEDFISPWVDLGNGVLSSTPGNVLNVNLSEALTAGVVRVLCCGTEE